MYSSFGHITNLLFICLWIILLQCLKFRWFVRCGIVIAGLQADVVKFLIFFLNLFLETMCAVSFSFAIGASVNSYGIGQVVLVMIFVLMMVPTSSVD